MTLSDNLTRLIKEQLGAVQALATTAADKEDRCDDRPAVRVETAPDPREVNPDQPLRIVYGFHPTPFGTALIAQTSGKICYLDFCDDSGTKLLADLRSHWPEAVLLEDQQATAITAGRIFQPEQERPTQPLTLYLKGSDFQRQVWQALLQILPGKIASYQQVAQCIGRPKAARAVGHAIGRNPICYLVPCHRVVRSDGSPGGYRSGTGRKEGLLRAELTGSD